MPTPETGHDNRYRQVARILHDVSKPMRVLAALNGPAELRTQFLACDGAKLPNPRYKPIDPARVLDGVQTVRRLLRPGIVDRWFAREASCIEGTGLLPSTVG